jgi:hypothetical protein
LTVIGYAFQEITTLSVQESRDCLEDRMGYTLLVLPVFLEISMAALMFLTATLTGYLAARPWNWVIVPNSRMPHRGDTCHASLTSFTSVL